MTPAERLKLAAHAKVEADGLRSLREPGSTTLLSNSTVDRVIDVLTRIAAALSRVEQLEAALRAVEWEGYLDYGISGCAECNRTMDQGHTESCIVAAALTGDPARPPQEPEREDR